MERFRDVYISVWKLNEEPVVIDDFPASAFDSPAEKARVAELFDEYNKSPTLDISPEMDRGFAEIARERTKRHPLRTYLWAPFGRALTMWFTPRTELLPIDGKFWPILYSWEDSRASFLATAVFGALGYLYPALAVAGIWIAWRYIPGGSVVMSAHSSYLPSSPMEDSPNLWGIALLAAYLLVRTAFLTTVEAPEPRYVVTCYPALLALAALVWTRKQ